MNYVPDRGDIVWLTFNPQAGHEQAGRRPALTLSPKSYNEKSGLALFCPITNHKKGYPFEVAVSEGEVTGIILTDQIRSLDWNARQAAFIQTAPDATLNAALQKVRTLL